MRKRAVVVCLSRTIQTNHTRWPLMKVAGQPVLRHLFDRLAKGLPDDVRLICVVLGKLTREVLGDTLAGTRVEIVERPEFTRLAAVDQVIPGLTDVRTVMLYPDNAMFPDLRTALAMLDAHESGKADATLAPEFPAGYLPEIFDTKALQRVAGMKLPPDLESDYARIMQRANQLFPGQKDFNFACRLFSSREHDAGVSLQSLPARMLIEDRFTLDAAVRVVAQRGASARYDGTEAKAFKEALREAHSAEPCFSIPVTKAGAPRVLYTTEFTAFSGAEQSFAHLAIHLDRTRYQPMALLPNEGELSSRLKAAGIPVEVTMFAGRTMDPTVYRFLSEFLVRNEVRLIHANGPPGQALLAASLAHRVPVVCHIRSFMGRDVPAAFRFAARVFTVSKAVREDVLRSDLEPDRVLAVYNGMDLTRFQPSILDRADSRRRLGLERDAPVIALVARITPQKRQEMMIEAMPRVLEKFPKAVVLFVGEPYQEDVLYMEQLERRIEELKIAGSVRFMGFCDDVRVPMTAADVLTLTTDNEPLGRCVLEAMALKLCTVLPKRGGHLELLRHNESSLFFEANHPANLAAELIRALASPADRERLAENAYTLVPQIDIRRHVQTILSEYDAILSK